MGFLGEEGMSGSGGGVAGPGVIWHIIQAPAEGEGRQGPS